MTESQAATQRADTARLHGKFRRQYLRAHQRTQDYPFVVTRPLVSTRQTPATPSDSRETRR